MRLNRAIVKPLKHCVFILVSFAIISYQSTNAKPTTTDVNNISDNEVEIGDPIREKSSIDHENRVRYVERMKLYMNNATSPCEDFYEYACGNYKNNMEKHYTTNKRNNLFDIIFKIQEALEDFLTTPVADDQYAQELNIAQQFYQSCLSAKLYPIQKSEVYLNVLKSIGGFPAVETNWQSNNFSWFNMTSHLSRFHINSLIKEAQTPVYPFAPYFELPYLGFQFPVNRYNINNNNSEAIIKNKQYMRVLLEAYEAKESEINKTIDEIINFWNKVINLTNVFDNDLEVCAGMIANTTDNINWQHYLEIVWSGTEFDVAESYNPPCDFFYTELDKICNQNKEVVANYLSLVFLFSMHSNFESAHFQHQYCLNKIYKSFPLLMDFYYMKKHFNSDIRKEVSSVLQNIRENLKLSLEDSDWMDQEIRAEALLKESTLEVQIGHSKDENITQQIISEMNNINLNKSNHEENLLTLRLMSAKTARYLGLNHKNLTNTTKPLELMLGSTVNAFYYSPENAIYVMAGILHPPTYHASWPDALKYGTLGYLVGHELTHSTDSLYDDDEIRRNMWRNKTKSVYEERGKCFVQHYDRYTIPEIDVHINGTITRAENIADDGGLRQSFGAYRRAQKQKLKQSNMIDNEKTNEQTMPGLDLTSEQLFFLGFAQLWCSAYNEEHLWMEQQSEHTIDKYRVLGALSNNEQFSQAFNCPVGSQMNNDKSKCRIF